MSVFTFAKDVTTLKYIYGKDLEFLILKHQITMEEAMGTMIKIGFQKGLDKKLEDEYWREDETK